MVNSCEFALSSLQEFIAVNQTRSCLAMIDISPAGNAVDMSCVSMNLC